MRHLHFNSLGGASGDMILGALLQLGANQELISEQLQAMLPNENFSINIKNTIRNSMTGFTTHVELPHEHHHEHGHHHHEHRDFAMIKDMIQKANLPENAKQLSIKAFYALACAEAKIHNSTPDDVHFHEVGAVDSIIDIVGSCLAFCQLYIDSISFDPLPLGSGTTTCQHGLIPLPAPATLALLEQIPTTQTDEPFELITPTGATLLTTFPNKKMDKNCKVITSVYSFGHRELRNRPNLLRASLFKVADYAERNEITILECNLDDCSPEIIGYACDKLLHEGALDVITTPCFMKKQRTGILLQVFCKHQEKDKFKKMLFQETSTFGIRERESKRTILKRKFCDVKTEFGIIKVKLGYYNDELVTIAPEMESCKKTANCANLPLKKVYDLAKESYSK